MPDNAAAWLHDKPTALKVGPAPYTPPGKGEIVIRNRAVAINPVDWAIPLIGRQAFPWVKYPAIVGGDVAGEVVEVGEGVTRFKVGDRVLGAACGLNSNRNRPAEGAFQIFVVLSDYMASPIPDSLSYEAASVLPLCLSTAACGLFQKDFLALQHPSADARPTGQTLLVWGGATSVGCNAIQLAVAAGYEVFATASPHNFDYLKSLGAAQVFDYRSRSVVADIIAALKGRTVAGALNMGSGMLGACFEILHASEGEKFVAQAAGPVSLSDLGSGGPLDMLRVMPKMLLSNVATARKARRLGVRHKFIFGGSLADNEVGPAIYVDFLPKALADGRFAAAPPALVVGQGLESIEAAFAVQRKGMSAQKVVVSL